MQGTPNGDLLIVAGHWRDKAIFFQKINPKNWQVKYSVGLSARKYDLTAVDIIPAYSLDDATADLVTQKSRALATYQDFLYLYKTPSAEKGETSNGRLERYALSLP